MNKLSRRDFIKNSMIAGATIAVAAPFSKVRGANNDIRVAVVGVGGQGGGHMRYFGGQKGARLEWRVCSKQCSTRGEPKGPSGAQAA